MPNLIGSGADQVPTNGMLGTAAFVDEANLVKNTGTQQPVSIAVNSSSPALTITQDGSGNALEVRDVTGDTTPFVINADGSVGAGVGAPVARLHINHDEAAEAAVFLQNPNAGGYVALRMGNSDRGTNGDHLVYGSASLGLRSKTGAPITFEPGGTERLRIDSSGNLGLGVTPSAWGSTRKVIQLSGGAFLQGRTDINQTLLGNNYYYDGSSFKYIANGFATGYEQAVGSHAWYTAPSGTAGNPITFTQAMTLDMTGRLTVNSSSNLVSVLNGTGGSGIYQTFSDNGTVIGDIGSANQIVGGSQSDFGVNARGARNLIFGTNNAERARIDSSGNLLVGATSGGFHVLQKSNAGNYVAAFYNPSATNPYGLHVSLNGVTGGAGNNILECADGGGTRFKVLGSGNCQNVNNSYGAISDLKLKDDITDASPKLAKLMQVRIVNYTLKSDPDKTKLIGVIAQELEQISPGLIEETPDFEEVTKTREVEVPEVPAVLDDEGNEVTPAIPASTRTEEYTERIPLGTVTKSVKYSVFVPMLIKGLQEQHAIVQSMQAQLDAQNEAMQLLAARLAALEAK